MNNPYGDPLEQEKAADSVREFGLNVVFSRRKTGLTSMLKSLEVGQMVELGEYSQPAVYPSAKQAGIKCETSKGADGKVYVRRVS